MNHRASSLMAKAILLPVIAMLSVPVWSCPVATSDGDFDEKNLTIENFSPLMSLKSDDVAVPETRALPATQCSGGFAGSYPCKNVDLMAFMPLSSIGGGSGNDIWGWTDSLSGKEYAIMGRTNGTAFVDISDPQNPVYLGNLPTHTGNSTWRDIKVNKNHAFIVSEASGHGMQVFDLTQLRNVNNPPQTFSNTTHYGEFSNAHNIVINEDSGFAYAVGTNTCSGGLHMIDVSNPASPSFAGCYSQDGYTHDAQCVIFQGDSHRFHHGSELCFNSNEDTLTIVDVTNKAAPVQLARLPYPNDGYTHQGWLTEDHQYFLLDDELDESQQGHNTKTRVFDVSDPEAPVLLGAYLSTAEAIDHNMYVKGDFAYQANYRAGLRVLEVLNPANAILKEEAYFDIYPSNDNPSFTGAWSVYPYYASGMVVISGIGSGLFIVKPTSLAPDFTLNVDPALVEVCGANAATAEVSLDAIQDFSLPVALTIDGIPPGVTATFSETTLVPPSTVTVQVEVNNAADGQYRLTIEGESGKIRNSTVLDVEVSSSSPVPAGVILPANGATVVSANQSLHWVSVEGAYRYDLEVATDVAFNNTIVTATGLTQNSYSAGGFPSDQTIYWRVTAHNACGATASSAASFTTASQICNLYTSSNVPIDISDDEVVTVTSNLVTNSPGQIVDVNVVDLRGTHTFIGDLTFQLQGPLVNLHRGPGNNRHSARGLVRIIEPACGSADNFYVSLDDDAPTVLPCPYTNQGTYQPSNVLSAFAGDPGTGDWTLIVSDNYPADGGSVQGWGLELCTTPEPLTLDSDSDGIADDMDNCVLVANADQRDTHGDGYGNICDPDLNNDGTVNFLDLSEYSTVFATTGSDLDADLNGDNAVNFLDLNIMKEYFFAPPGPSGIAIR